ncbi:MAG: hypothetical protein JKY10_08205 [Cohaesibacteraceae bacterium]|nr:hypothetical protein [Cohaesibacteraceae bacterium]
MRDGGLAVTSLDEVVKEYFKARTDLADSTLRKYRGEWENNFMDWQKLVPHEVTVEMCQKRFLSFSDKRGPVAANHSIIFLQGVFTWAIKRRLLPYTFVNPC